MTPFVLIGDLIANRGSLIYRQARTGRNGGTFEMLKFRTMRTVPADRTTDWTGEEDVRITPFGRMLRRTHLDELPQVVNILRGDLSVVGPRPEQPQVVAELVDKIPFYRLRHLVRPGLTGWAQVKYQYAGTEAETLEKLQYEFYLPPSSEPRARSQNRRPDRSKCRRKRGQVVRAPSVTVVIPTFNEERHLRATLESVRDQTYGGTVEVIVADGRSTDRTRDVALEFSGVRVVDNPKRAQSAGLNRALEAAHGEITVRVDGHCVLADDYVECCVEALEATGAAMVGGGMTPAPSGASATQRGIASAMASRLGAGPARFHVGGKPGWVDTVYLGAFRTNDANAAGGYAEDVGVNEDAEFAIRMRPHGGIWFDPRIRSVYSPRSTVSALAKQFYRYGRSRALTARRHPREVRLRQLAAPALVLGMLSGRRRQIAVAYASVVLVCAAREVAKDRESAWSFAAALPVMHFCWGVGFIRGALLPQSVGRATEAPRVDELLNPT